MNRIRRLIGAPNNRPKPNWLAGVGLLLALTGVLVLNLQIAYAQASCDNPFYPVSEGATWTYMEPDMPIISPTHVLTISEVDDASFTVARRTITFGDHVRDLDEETWNCTAEGLFETWTTFDYAVDAYVYYGTVAVERTVVTGVNIPQPSEWRVGYTWTVTRQFKAGPNEDELTAYYDLSERREHEIVAKEQITVPAGTFEAYRVDISNEFGGTIRDSESNTTQQGSFWYVEGVGLVKRVVESPSLINPHVTTRNVWELQSYDLGEGIGGS